MKQTLFQAVPSNAGATVTLPAGISPSSVLAILDLTSGQVLFKAGLAALVATSAGQVVTLNLSAPAMTTGDELWIVYDDGQSALVAGGTVNDAQSAPFSAWPAVAVDTAIANCRSLGVLCTVAGNVGVKDSLGNILPWPVTPGWQTFTGAVVQVVSGSTTATATYYNLK